MGNNRIKPIGNIIGKVSEGLVSPGIWVDEDISEVSELSSSDRPITTVSDNKIVLSFSSKEYVLMVIAPLLTIAVLYSYWEKYTSPSIQSLVSPLV